MDYYYYAGFFSEFLAAFSATVFLYKYKHTTLFWLLPLLWFILINDLVTQYIFPRMPLGYLLSNVYRVLVPLVIILLVGSQVKKKKLKTIIRFIAIINIVLTAIELFVINPLTAKTSFSFTTASVLIVICLVIYFMEELKRNQVINVNRKLFLWVCFGF